MKKLLITAAALSLICGSAFAQGTTAPTAQQDNMAKPGMTNGSMDKGSSMNKGTTGMSNDMKKDGMSNGTMSKSEMKKDSMKKDNMSK